MWLWEICWFCGFGEKDFFGYVGGMEVRGKEKIRLGWRGVEKGGVGEEGGGWGMRRWE